MADIRCPNCGRDNPDFLDACQFCQTPLTPESMVHTGDKPTKKNTGELEPILPEWLRDVRQQARDSAEEGELPASATKPRVQKSEPPDLLAGLASQNEDDDDEVPDWLASLGPTAKPKAPDSASPEPSIDFFAQFNKGETAPEKPALQVGEPPKQEPPAEKDELSEWFTGVSSAPSEPFAVQPGVSADESGWLKNLGAPEPVAQPAPEEKEDLSWLHDLEASAKQAEAPKQESAWDFEPPSTPSSTPQEDLSWLNTLGGVSEPAQPAAAQPSQPDDLSWLDNLGGTSEPVQPAVSQPSQQEDLSWLNALGGTSEPAEPAVSQPSHQEDLSWLDNLGGTSGTIPPSVSQPSQAEDLGWLKDLGGATEAAPPSPPQEDLGWLDTLGGAAEPVQPEPAPSAAHEDLDWLGKLTEASAPGQPEPAQETSQDDLEWLKNFAASTQTPEPAAKGSQDLDWLDTLGTLEPSQPAPVEPAAPQEDIDWLAGLGEIDSSVPASAKPFGTTDELSPPKGFDENVPPHISPFVPRRTAPLSDAYKDEMPDWLKSATEEQPSLPLGADALEQYRESPRKPSSEALPPAPGLEPIEPDIFPASVPEPISNQELDSLLSMEMPDWLSQPQPGSGEIQSAGTPAQPVFDESLSPVELPSWVQAMRPVEAVLSETPSIDSQPTEKEGPLAGLRGVIPSAPIGSSRRPRAISLKLQATEEQQAGAALFDQILAGESAPRAVPSLSAVTSQNVLRWAIAGILIVILSVVVFMRSQFMPVWAIQPADVESASNAIAAIPVDSSVLVVVDYEPSLAGEMEAVSAPVLNQLILTRQPRLVFLSTSPSGAGLIERLLATARISAPNLGYLPGGSAGIAGFMAQPNSVIPSAAAQFSGYSAVILLTDNSESGRGWIEQLAVARQTDPTLATQSLILVTSAQAGPLLQPYVSSKQAAGMVNGLADAVRFEYANNIPVENRIARTYWDAFGIGILLAVILIIIGSVWSLVIGIRARRASSEQG